MPEPQAEALAEAFKDAQGEAEFATKQAIADLRRDLKELEAKLTGNRRELDTKLTRDLREVEAKLTHDSRWPMRDWRTYPNPFSQAAS